MITACLLSWRRKYHLPEICESLSRFDMISEIVIYQNESDGTFPVLPDGVRLIENAENRFVMGRFLAAKEAKNEIVFFQDDDLIVDNVEELILTFLEYNSERIVANLAEDNSSRHWTWWKNHSPPWIELGFGSIAARSMVDVLDEWPYDKYLLDRKADKVFTIANPWEKCLGKIRRLYHNGVESGRDDNALWLRGDHNPLNGEAVKLASEWEKMRNRNS